MREQRSIDMRTLAIASAASAAAALVTSQFWIRGTPLAAALTPIIVTLVSELLHRPTEKIAQRLTTETDALPEAAGAVPPPPSEETAPRPAPDTAVKVHRSESARRKRRIAWATVLGTGLLAFGIAAAALTIPEAIGGRSLVDSDRRTTLGGAEKQQAETAPATEVPTEATTETETVTETTTAPAPTPKPSPRSAPDRTTPTTTPTTTAPERSPPPTTTTEPDPVPAR
jgi:cytoskeletal protein RodZ